MSHLEWPPPVTSLLVARAGALTRVRDRDSETSWGFAWGNESQLGLSFRVELPDLITSENFGLSRVGPESGWHGRCPSVYTQLSP